MKKFFFGVFTITLLILFFLVKENKESIKNENELQEVSNITFAPKKINKIKIENAKTKSLRLIKKIKPLNKKFDKSTHTSIIPKSCKANIRDLSEMNLIEIEQLAELKGNYSVLSKKCLKKLNSLEEYKNSFCDLLEKSNFNSSQSCKQLFIKLKARYISEESAKTSVKEMTKRELIANSITHFSDFMKGIVSKDKLARDIKITETLYERYNDDVMVQGNYYAYLTFLTQVGLYQPNGSTLKKLKEIHHKKGYKGKYPPKQGFRLGYEYGFDDF